jgi:hypothetical protein
MASTPHNSFFRRFVNRQAAPTQDDPADMGTAFGLEASLGPVGDLDAEEGDDDGTTRSEHAPMDWLNQRGHRPKR